MGTENAAYVVCTMHGIDRMATTKKGIRLTSSLSILSAVSGVVFR